MHKYQKDLDIVLNELEVQRINLIYGKRIKLKNGSSIEFKDCYTPKKELKGKSIKGIVFDDVSNYDYLKGKSAKEAKALFDAIAKEIIKRILGTDYEKIIKKKK